ncbi:MAG: hypothetical protein MN733_03275 [Nitrososphaera sp.]|nr:hypothetical protein [Nitrososphaera sp.]
MPDKPLVGWPKAWAQGPAGAIAEAIGADFNEPSLHDFADSDIGRSIATHILYKGADPELISMAKQAYEQFKAQQTTTKLD